MIHVVKILFILAIILLLDYPFITGKGKLAKLFPASGLRYYKPHNRKNFYFVLLIVAQLSGIQIMSASSKVLPSFSFRIT